MPRLNLHDLDPEDLQPESTVQAPEALTRSDEQYFRMMIDEAINEGKGSEYASVSDLMTDVRKALATDNP